MVQYGRKVVPFSVQVMSGQSAKEVSRQRQQVINKHAKQGWEFCTLDDVNIK
jgi:hypothetical protein